MVIFSENKSHDEKPQGTHQDDDHQERARWKRGSTNRYFYSHPVKEFSTNSHL